MHDVVESTPIEPIRKLINTFNAELYVLNVDFEKQNFSSSTPEEYINLDTMLAGLNPIYENIENKDVDQGISEFAEKNNLDLVITLPKKHSFLEKVFEKSHTRDLIHHTNIPLLCLQVKQGELVS
jgi:K+-sensing histidine kinase KdpD